MNRNGILGSMCYQEKQLAGARGPAV